MAAHDAGVQVDCPGCGRRVGQKTMIPVLGPDGHGVRYLCAACARALIVPTSEAGDAGSDSVSDGDSDVDGDSERHSDEATT